MADRVGDQDALDRVVGAAVDQVAGGRFAGFSWLTDLLDAAVQTARLRVRSDLILFRKALLMLEGVIADIGNGGVGRLDATLTATFLVRLAGEWPGCLIAPPWSRAFGTRLSNADLWRLGASLPGTLACWWIGLARQALRGPGAVGAGAAALA